MAGEIDHSHPAVAQYPLDAVFSERLAYEKGRFLQLEPRAAVGAFGATPEYLLALFAEPELDH